MARFGWWLEQFTFVTTWIGATLASGLLAIYRQSKLINHREAVNGL